MLVDMLWAEEAESEFRRSNRLRSAFEPGPSVPRSGWIPAASASGSGFPAFRRSEPSYSHRRRKPRRLPPEPRTDPAGCRAAAVPSLPVATSALMSSAIFVPSIKVAVMFFPQICVHHTLIADARCFGAPVHARGNTFRVQRGSRVNFRSKPRLEGCHDRARQGMDRTTRLHSKPTTFIIFADGSRKNNRIGRAPSKTSPGSTPGTPFVRWPLWHGADAAMKLGAGLARRAAHR